MGEELGGGGAGGERGVEVAAEGDDVESVGEGLGGEFFGGEAPAAGDFAELEVEVGGAVVGAVDEFGAGEAVAFAEVEEEVVEFALVAHGLGDGMGDGGMGEVGAEDGAFVDGEGIFGGAEADAVFFGFDEADGVGGEGVGGDGEVVAGGFGADVEGGVGPVAGEEPIAEGVVVAGEEDVAGLGEGEEGVAVGGLEAFGGAGWFGAGLAHFGDGESAEAEEVEHGAAVAGVVAAEEGEPAVGEDFAQQVARRGQARFFGLQEIGHLF